MSEEKWKSKIGGMNRFGYRRTEGKAYILIGKAVNNQWLYMDHYPERWKAGRKSPSAQKIILSFSPEHKAIYDAVWKIRQDETFYDDGAINYLKEIFNGSGKASKD